MESNSIFSVIQGYCDEPRVFRLERSSESPHPCLWLSRWGSCPREQRWLVLGYILNLDRTRIRMNAYDFCLMLSEALKSIVHPRTFSLFLELLMEFSASLLALELWLSYWQCSWPQESFLYVATSHIQWHKELDNWLVAVVIKGQG